MLFSAARSANALRTCARSLRIVPPRAGAVSHLPLYSFALTRRLCSSGEKLPVPAAEVEENVVEERAVDDADASRYYVSQDTAEAPYTTAHSRGVDQMYGKPPSWTRASSKQTCLFCQMGKERLQFRDEVFDPVNVPLWLRFLTPTGRILGKKITGTCSKHQRKVARVIKRCRHMGFISYKEGYKVWSPFAMYHHSPEEDDWSSID